MNIQVYNSGAIEYSYCDKTITLPKEATTQMLLMLDTWQQNFPPENTYVFRTYGVSRLWVRFDGVWNEEEGRFLPFEIQGGSGWMGYAGLTNPTFKAARDHLIETRWPLFKLLIHGLLLSSDDMLWVERTRMEDALASDSPLLLRPRYYDAIKKIFGHETALLLESRSVASLRFHLSKEYGVSMRWWKKIHWNETMSGEQLPWNESFVLKPLFGFGSKDIMIWKPDREGRATRTQIRSALQARGVMYLQPLHTPPILDLNSRKYHVIHRPFFGYDTAAKRWLPLHGVWTARPTPNMRIHGASDAISGPLLMKQDQ